MVETAHVKCTEMLILNSFNFSELNLPMACKLPRVSSRSPLVVDFDSLLHIIIS